MEYVEYSIPEGMRKAYEKLPTALCVFRLIKSRCRLLLVSDGMCALLGLDRDEIFRQFSKQPSDCVCPEDYDDITAADAYILLHPEEEYRAAYRMKGPDGNYFWAVCRGRTERLEDGSLLLYAQYFNANDQRDVSIEKKADEIRSEALLREVLATTKTAIFWKDADRRFLGVNRAFLDYYGYENESELIGKNDEDMGWHTDPDKFKNDELEILKTGKSTYRVHGKCLVHGEERDIVASKSPMYSDGRITGIVGSFEDVTTEYRQREEISELNRRLTREIAENAMLMESANVYILKMKVDDDLTVEWGSPSMYRATGYSREELDAMTGGKLRGFYKGFEDQFELLLNAVKQANDRNEPRFELTLHMPSAKGPRWIKGVGTFWDYGGSPPKAKSFYAVYTDVTEVINTQERLRIAEREAERAKLLEGQNERLMNTIDSVPSGIGILRSSPGKPDFMTVNRYFSEKIGFDKDKLAQGGIGYTMEFIHPDDRERAEKDMRSFFAGEDIHGCTYRVKKAGADDFFWVHVSGRIIPRPDGGKTVYFAYTNVDSVKKAEEELRSSRRIYEQAVKTAKLVVWEYDVREGRVTMLDDEYSLKNGSGVTLPKVIEDVPEGFSRIVEEADMPKLRAMYDRVRDGEDASCEVWFKTDPGAEPRCDRLVYAVIRGEDGRAMKAYGIGQNITAQKIEERKYAKAYEQLAQAHPYSIGSFHLNLTANWCGDGRSTRPFVLKLQNSGTVDGSFAAFAEFIADDDVRETFLRDFNRQKLLEAFREGQTQLSLEYPIVYPDGERYWRRGLVFMLQNPATGDVEAFAYAVDIDAQRKNEQAVKHITSEELDYIGLIHPNTRTFEFLTKQASLKYGEIQKRMDYAACCEYVGTNFVDEDEHSHFEECTRLETILEGLKKTGKWAASYKRTQNGAVSRRHLQYSWLDKPGGDILVIRTDVTAAYEQEQMRVRRMREALLSAEQANEAKSSFLSSMSHDLRTPLNGVLGFTDIALNEKDPAKKQEYLEKIKMSGSLLLGLVNDTLDLSRIESGKTVLAPEPVNARELIATVGTSMQPTAELKGVELDIKPDSFPDETVWIDRLNAQKVLVNLLSNAIKYTPEGGKVSVRAEKLEPKCGGRNRRLVVEDSGIGMSPDFMPHLFEPFSQENRPEAGGVGGTGLGLSIVKRIVDLMGGVIDVKSEPGKGTRFTIDLPLRIADEAQPVRAEKPAGLSGRKLLLCEDNPLNTEIAVILLRGRGFAVDTAPNGSEGAAKFADSAPGEYSAVLMDIRMPVMDGYEATKAIRAMQRPDAGTVPIIAMTADAFEENIRQAREAGMTDYVTKPVDMAKLMDILCREIS